MTALSLCLLLVAVVVAVRNDAALSEEAMAAPADKAVPVAPAALVEESGSAASEGGSDLTAQATARIEAALGLDSGNSAGSESEGANENEGKQDRNGFLKVLYDELKKLSDSSFAPMPTSNTPSALPADAPDPRVSSLERKLAMFERQRQKTSNHAQDAAISGINERLEGLDRTLSALKRSAQQQQMLAQQLLRGAQSGADAVVDTRPDFSVLYAKASLPADFDARVQEILDTVRVEARKIYEKHCINTPRPGTGTPKSYPREKTPSLTGRPAKAPAKAPKRRIPSVPSKYRRLPERAPANPNADPEPEHVQRHSPPIPLVKPVMKGKEPTPQELRKLKAMLDIQRKLPIIPAYHLPNNQKALQDVLGEDAVSAKWKST